MTGLFPATPRTRWVIGLTSWGLLMGCSSCGLFDFLTPCAQMDADATITLSRETLNQIVLKQATLEEAIDSGDVKITGNKAKLDEMLSYLDTFEFWFNIVTP